MSHYEKSFQNENHHHLICTQCNSVTEVKDEEVNNVIKNKKYHKFNLTNFNLYVYGVCHKCMTNVRKNSIHK